MPVLRAAAVSIAGAATLVALGAPPAAAQSAEDRADARALADEGARAFERGRHAQAVDRLQRAEQLVHSPVHLLFLARAFEALGRLVEAREAYLAVRRERLDASAPEAFREARRAASEELRELEPRIPHVTIEVAGAGDREVTLTLDGRELPPGIAGVRRPIDPGKHKLRASAPGMRGETLRLVVREGDERTVELALEPGEAREDETKKRGDAGKQRDGASRTPVLGWTLLGAGALGVGGGAWLLADAAGVRERADELCRQGLPASVDGCNRQHRAEIDELDSEAGTKQGVGIAALVIGGATLSAGLVLLLGEDAGHEAALRPWLGTASAGVRGRFQF